MADEPDGISETFEASARVALTAAGLMAERMARARHQAQHDAQAASDQDARELQLRVDAERGAARASVEPVGRDEWWQRASAQETGDAWQTANAWRDVDPDAQRTSDRMGDELRNRYAIDVDIEQEADAETVEARVVSDTNQARPADEALASGGPQRTPAARRTRGKSAQTRSQPRRSERGR